MGYGVHVDITEREQEVFRLVAEGLSHGQIASRLNISAATVKTTMLRVRKKLGAQSTAQAVLIAERYYRHLLAGAIAKHGTRGARASHLRYGTPLCDQCQTLEGDARKPPVITAYRPHEPKTDRLRPSEPAVCGTMPAVRRHQRNGDRIAELTCGCREANAAWWREYRLRNSQASEAA